MFKGRRLNSTVINYTHADTALSCIFHCARDNYYCRSINFNLKSNSERNCEFLKDVSTEKPRLLLEDEHYDYYILTNRNRVSILIREWSANCHANICNFIAIQKHPFALDDNQMKEQITVAHQFFLLVYKIQKIFWHDEHKPHKSIFTAL